MSVDLNIVCPTSFNGLYVLTFSATTTSLRIYSAEDGFINLSSKSVTFGLTPYNTLNNILIDSSIPLIDKRI